MDRRLVLKVGSLAGFAAIVPAVWLTVRGSESSLSFSAVPQSMQALYNPKFLQAFPSLSTDQLLAELSERGVYGQRRFRVSQIRANAASDALVEFDNFLYTESELLLYATLARWQADGRIVLP